MGTVIDELPVIAQGIYGTLVHEDNGRISLPLRPVHQFQTGEYLEGGAPPSTCDLSMMIACNLGSPLPGTYLDTYCTCTVPLLYHDFRKGARGGLDWMDARTQGFSVHKRLLPDREQVECRVQKTGFHGRLG